MRTTPSAIFILKRTSIRIRTHKILAQMMIATVKLLKMLFKNPRDVSQGNQPASSHTDTQSVESFADVASTKICIACFQCRGFKIFDATHSPSQLSHGECAIQLLQEVASDTKQRHWIKEDHSAKLKPLGRTIITRDIGQRNLLHRFHDGSNFDLLRISQSNSNGNLEIRRASSD